MPACSCPRCHTQIWVKDEQLKIAQGFVVCTKCEGLFKATENIVDLKGFADGHDRPPLVARR